jgi:membrane AbrB-like protein
MTVRDDAGPARPRYLGRQAPGLQWGAMLALSAILVVLLEQLRLPAALLLGPMIAAILLAALEGTARLPAYAFLVAQGLVGCLMARSMPLAILGEIARNWPLFIAGVVSVVAAAGALGWLLTRWQALPGTTAVWGSWPGAATVMVLMAEAYGADMRLVAFMQYLRVVTVTLVATLLSRLWIGATGPAPAIAWFPPVAWMPLLETVGIAGLVALIAPRLRVPAGPMMLGLVASVLLQDAAGMQIELPPWLLAITYAVIGWGIGLRFTRPILLHAARVLPRVLAFILTLVAICGLFAAVFVVAAGIDPLTAYLATSPGGADSVAIIAASSPVDVPFVMAMQTARFLVVLFAGPSLARFIARRAVGGARP